MLEPLRNFIYAQTNPPEEEFKFFVSLLKPLQVKKGEYLFKQGESSNVVAFIAQGLLFTYYKVNSKENSRENSKENSKEKSTELANDVFQENLKDKRVEKFAPEATLISPYSALLSGHGICNFSAIALENSVLYYITYAELQNLYTRHPSWHQLARRMAEMYLVEKEIREYQTLCLPLTEQYDNFLKIHQPIINRIPQYLIASYLGINAASLSRLRAQRFK